jgi:gliding motility-associated-like protein
MRYLYLCLLFVVSNTLVLFSQEKQLTFTEPLSLKTEQLKSLTSNPQLPKESSYPKGFEQEERFSKLYDKDGPYSYINQNAELLDKRDATSKSFMMNDGRVTVISSAGQAHYKKDGLWHTILNDIYPSNTYGIYGYACINNSYQTYFPNKFNDGIKVNYENNKSISLVQNTGIIYLDENYKELTEKTAFTGIVNNVKDNYINYTNLLPGVHAKIENLNSKFTLDYEIENLSSINIPTGAKYVSFREGIKLPEGTSYIFDYEKHKLMFLDAKNKPIIGYKVPVIYEKNNPYGDNRIATNYHVTKIDDLFYVDILVPIDWIMSSDRVFPLIIDPTVTLNPNNAFAWTFTVEEDAGCDYGTDNDMDDNMRIGFDDGTFDNDNYQNYCSFNITSIPDNACIQNAQVWYYLWNQNNGSGSDNYLRFWWQAYDPITTDPVPQTCDDNYTFINTTTTAYVQYDVFGICGGPCTDFNESIGWKNWPTNVNTRVTSCLVQNFVAFSLDNIDGHSDAFITNNDEWLDFRGYSNANRPQLIVTYQTPYIAATSISGTSTICSGQSTTLTRVGGTTGSDGNWTWYAGGCGTGGAIGTGSSITVSPTTTTTYYLRGEGTCGNTGCVSITVTVNSLSTAPTAITGTTSICSGGSTTLTATGGSFGTGAVVRWYTGGCGTTLVATGNPVTFSPTSTTTYYARYEDTCNNTSCASVTVTVNTASTAPTSISASSNPICTPSSTTLTAVGGTAGTGATLQWYTGSCGGTSAGTGASITVSPIVTTTYYVRYEGACGNTTCAQVTITVNTPSTAPTSISGTTTICSGGSTTLSAVGGTAGTGASLQWYSGSCGGTLVGTGASVIVSPTSTTTYFVRYEGTCNTTSCATTSIVVQDTSRPAINITGATSLCIGESTTLAVSGGFLGTGASWNWYTGSCGGTLVGTGLTLNVSALTTTTYYLRAEGTCNNTNCISYTVVVNPLPNGSISGTTTICSGTSTNLTFNFSSGHSPFDIIYSDGTSTFSLSGVIDGQTISVSPSSTTTYTFTSIVDSNSCTRTSGFTGGATVTVTNSPIITSVTSTNVRCFGDSNATISIVASGGTGTLNYSIDNGATTQLSNSFIGLSIGSYTIYVSDANSCFTTYSLNPIVITQPTPLDVTTISVDASCGGIFDGQINTSGSGGTAPYNYSLNGGAFQLGTNFSGLGAGTYLIQIQDANLCTDTASVIIDNSYTLQDTLTSKTNITCAGASNGSFTVNAFGGVSPYQYSLDGIVFNSLNTFSGLSAGSYNVIARDSRGCQHILNVTIVSPSVLSVVIDSVVNGLCSGGTTGAIYTSAFGGTSPYTYSWSNSASTADISSLSAGTYTLIVTDSNGCTASISQTITTPPALFLNVAGMQNVRCNGGATAFIDITTNGGTPPYSYAWSNGSTIEDQINIIAGTYSITVTDANGCTRNITQVISEPAILSSTGIVSNVICHGGLSGSIDISVLGGTSPYTYLWSNGTTSQDLSGVNAGNYTVIINDVNGCSTSGTYTITEPVRLNVSSVSTNVLCFGANNGTIDVSVSGGSTPYIYLWNDAVNTEDRSALSPGNYSVTITDNNGCNDSISASISQPDSLNTSSSQTNVSCAGRADATINLSVNGGIAPYTYIWSDGSTLEDRISLVGGPISVTITDANLCTKILNFTIIESAPLASSLVGTNPTCYGGANGSINLTTSGGTSPLSYLWNTFDNTEDLSSLVAGLYTVIITDANGCTRRDTISLSQPAQISITHTNINPLCFGANTGTIDITVTGGTTPYSFIWNDGNINEDRTSLLAGLYSVTVTDANTCSASHTINITSPSIINITGVVADVRCTGGSTGSINITTSGGSGPYTYLWSNGTTTEDISFVVAGTYTITVTDANSCPMVQSFTINQPTVLSGIVRTHDVTCFGGNDGSARAIASGGIAPYNYFWASFVLGDTISGQRAGNYAVLVTDFNGCQTILNGTIGSPAVINPNFAITNARCFNSTNGFVTTSATGGVGPYTYTWSNGATTSFINPVAAGTYVLTTTDNVGCTHVDTAIVGQPDSILAHGVVSNLSCYGDNSGAINITATGGNPAYGYSWTLPDGSTSFVEDIIPASAGVYFLAINDVLNCVGTDTFIVTQPDSLAISSLVDNVTCNGANNGRIDIDVNGGTPTYRFTWSNGATTEDLINIGDGTYTVTVTDANNCIAIKTYTVTEPALLNLILNPTNPTCFGTNNGSIDAIVSGGTSPYNYSWSTFESTSSISSLGAGSYSITITDANGCNISGNTILTQPTSINIAGTVTNLTCYNNNSGAIDLSIASGGVSPFSYNWSNGDTSQDLTAINSGTYVVTVSDDNSCTTTASFSLSQPDSMFSNISAVSPNCNGGNTGFAEVDVFGGTPAYSYVWNTLPIQTTNIASNLSVGTYTVTITDINGCILTTSVNVSNASPLAILVNNVNSTCASSTNGSITITATGGRAPYTYLLNGISQTTNIFTGLGAGSYSIEVKDANGCSVFQTTTISAPNGFDVDLTSSDLVIGRGDVVTLTATNTSSLPIIAYDWSPLSIVTCTNSSCSIVSSSPIETTLYTVTAMNSDSCTSTDTITVIVRQDKAVFIPSAFTPNGDGKNDNFDFQILGAKNVAVSIWDRWGENVYQNANQQNGAGQGWNGTYKGVTMQLDTYTYQFDVTYYDGSKKVLSGSVIIMK